MEYSDLSRIDKILAPVVIKLKKITVKDIEDNLASKGDWQDYQTTMINLHTEAMDKHGAGLELHLVDEDFNPDGYVKHSISIMAFANRVVHNGKFIKDRWQGSDPYPEIEYV